MTIHVLRAIFFLAWNLYVTTLYKTWSIFVNLLVMRVNRFSLIQNPEFNSNQTNTTNNTTFLTITFRSQWKSNKNHKYQAVTWGNPEFKWSKSKRRASSAPRLETSGLTCDWSSCKLRSCGPSFVKTGHSSRTLKMDAHLFVVLRYRSSMEDWFDFHTRKQQV